MSANQFRGTGVALVTPFKSNKTVDFNALEKLVDVVIDGGVDVGHVVQIVGRYQRGGGSDKHR